MTDADATAVVDCYQDLRDRLIHAGVLIGSTVKGLYGKGAAFVHVFDGLDALVTEAGQVDQPELMRFPPLLPREHFVRTDYVRSFPDLIGSVHSFLGGDREHAALLQTLADDGPWSTELDPTELVLVPAACYPIYPTISGILPRGGRTFDVLGSCFRHEGSDDPARMMTFHQHEFVHVGTPESALAFRNRWLERSQILMKSIGLDVADEVANDPFFGRAGRMLAANQRGDALKFEVVATVANPEKSTAIVSCNCHQDHLTIPFGINTHDGGVAHSACVGFGMERIVLALFARHGMDLELWPREYRSRLGV